MIYILYNSKSKSGYGMNIIDKIKKLINHDVECVDVIDINVNEFYKGLNKDDEIILCGGDGTINNFVNAIYDDNTGIKVKYFKSGSGNDFARDVRSAEGDGFIELNPYIENLPELTVKGRIYRFLNGVGYGVDAYCCEKINIIKGKYKKKANYSLIALRGLFFDYTPVDAKITVDGKVMEYTKVLMASVMNGRFFGGGVMIAPGQERLNKERKVSLVVVHNLGKLRALTIFPFLYSGKHVANTDVVTIIKGNEIKVEVNRPAPLQIDGETISDVTQYHIKSGSDK